VPPLRPHAVGESPGMQKGPRQHPVGQELASQMHTSPRQRWPAGQDPEPQRPPQPSAAPQLLPAQSGVQPHTPGTPPPPQVCPGIRQTPPGQQARPSTPQITGTHEPP
jgi:hypothetical protein